MASTYSTSLKLQLIGNGDQSGVWGSTTNTNLNLVEQAVAGVVTITMLNADYTLSNLNGVSDESRNMVIVAGGTNSDIRKIVAPLVEKFYVVSNQTIGGYAITIGGSTGSYVTIPFGTTGQVYCDGTNFYSAQTTSAGSFTANGNFVASGTSTFNGNVATSAGSVLVVAGPMVVANTAAFSGTTTAPTVSSGDNSNNVATTAFVKTITNALGTMSTQNANNVSITGGTITGLSNLATSTFTSTGATKLVSSGTQIRNVVIGSNEIAIAQSNNPVFLNLCDADGNNGTGYSLQIRGLASAGSAGVNLTSIDLATNSLTRGGYEIGKGLGFGGTSWNNVTGSRALNVTYTNSYTYPIMVIIFVTYPTGGANAVQFFVDGGIVAQQGGNFSTDTNDTTTFIVPPGQTYRASVISGTVSLGNWVELY